MTVHRTPDPPVDSTIAALVGGYSMNAPLEQNLAAVTAAAVRLVEGVDYADVMVISEGHLRSVSPTAPLLVDLDDLQLDLRNGPCLQAAVEGAMIRCTDLREDTRWPGFAAAALDVGVRSVLSFQIRVHRRELGALNLFGRGPRTVDPDAEAIGALLATLATVALDAAERERQFGAALASRDLIGQAKGILMNHFKVDADRAFDMLRTLSQDGNTPLRTLAQDIIDTL